MHAAAEAHGPVDPPVDRLDVVIDDRCTGKSPRRELQRHRQRQIEMFAVSLAAIVLSQLLVIVNERQIALRPFATIPLPETCPAKFWLHGSCPGCGLTRSILALAEGDIARSVRFHALGWLMAALIVAQIPYRIYVLAVDRDSVPPRPWARWCGYLVIAALIVNWLLSLVNAGFTA